MKLFFAALICSLTLCFPSMAEVTGRLDGADPEAIIGWAWDSEQEDQPVDVVIEAVPAGSDQAAYTWNITADAYREDVEAYLGSGEHGFFLGVDWFEIPEEELTITAYALDGSERVPLAGMLTYRPAEEGIAYPTPRNDGTDDGFYPETGPGIAPLPSYDTAGAPPEPDYEEIKKMADEAADETGDETADKTNTASGETAENTGNNSQAQLSSDGNWKQGESLGIFTTTGYCTCSLCTKGAGLTYSGTVPKGNHTLGADLSQFPLGTKLMIDGIVYTVEDTGSAVSPNHVDIYYDNHAAAVAHGTRKQEVFRVVPAN